MWRGFPFAGALLALAGPARAGDIVGVVIDRDSGALVPGATVVATSPAMQGTQAAITDESGYYRLTDLRGGIYQVSFYYAESTVERAGVAVPAAGATVVNVRIDQPEPIGCVFWCSAPMIDIASERIEVVVEGLDFFNLPRPRWRFPVQGPLRVDGVPWPAGAPPPPDAFLDELTILWAGFDTTHAGIAPIATAALDSGSNQHQFDLRTRRSSGGSESAARIGGPIARDHAWYFLGIAPHHGAASTDLAALARLDYAHSPEHQATAFLYLDHTPASRSAVLPFRAAAGGVEAHEPTILATAATWRSRFDDNKLELALGASFTRAMTRTTRDDHTSTRATITRRARLLGHHDARAGLEAGRGASQTSSATTDLTTSVAWLHDSWAPRPDLTLAAGLRWEREQRFRGASATLHTALVPRAGLIWDWTREGRSRAFVSAGRFRAPATATTPPRVATEVLPGAEYELIEDLAVLAAVRVGTDERTLMTGLRKRGGRLTAEARYELAGLAGGGDAIHRLALDATWRGDLCIARGLFVGTHVALGVARDASPGAESAGLQLGKRFSPTSSLDLDVALDLVTTATERTLWLATRVAY